MTKSAKTKIDTAELAKQVAASVDDSKKPAKVQPTYGQIMSALYPAPKPVVRQGIYFDPKAKDKIKERLTNG